MKKILMLVCWIAGLNVFALPVAKINLRVVDEAGSPIQGAKAAIHFDVFRERKVFEGVTDSNGLFCAQAETQLCVTELAEKEGYYKSRETPYLPATLNKLKTRYEPWGAVHTMTMRKIIEPKEGKLPPTSSGTLWLGIPAYDKAVGFDVLESDWVAPYGKGKDADFVFTFSKDTEKRILSYVLTFSNQGDGIMEYSPTNNIQSVFRWPHKAPLDGYASVMERMTGYDRSDAVIPIAKKFRKQNDINYIYRVRTVFDERGNVKSALYGKITGEMELIINPDEFKLRYWLNTDPTSRSLESTDPYSP